MQKTKREFKDTHIKLTFEDKLFEIISYVFLTILGLVCLYPLYFTLIASISDPQLVNSGQIMFLPRNIMMDGYEKVFAYKPLWRGYGNTIIYTLLGTTLNIFLTMITAYPMSRKKFIGKNFFLFYLMFTMYFSGGLIPTFLIVKQIGLYNNWMVMIVMGMISITNVIIARTFIQNSIPEELIEAASIDGLNHYGIFAKMVLPLSKPIIIVLCLYYGVGHWNNYWTAMIYLNDQNLFPLQLILRGLLTANQLSADLASDYEDAVRMQNMVDLMKYGMVIAASLPLLIVYPFLQKYFTKGVMIGSVKG